MDESTLALLDKLIATSGTVRNRSAVIRAAVREFAEQARHREVEAHEGRILKEHRKRLARETAALIKEQARP